ncbi:hypothetical protein [Kribbella sindirgiensis]|uniref:Uncharacterized protein n=1 Tax=Kribbella sindirgiensis TaxID=1124744 RepID=A0A4R0J0Q8_9ACTN|nr:hypothetical protein [Kribbella sindirgiensis]TCC39379.1 hypothetical protein E0H50_05440 [Kribbella sindirgiensis]
MVEFILFLFWLVIAALAVVGAVQTWNWLASDERRDELAERERQAELEIQNISYQAQMAMLNEALKRSRPDFEPSQPLHFDVIEGEVAPPDDDSNRPS